MQIVIFPSFFLLSSMAALFGGGGSSPEHHIMAIYKLIIFNTFWVPSCSKDMIMVILMIMTIIHGDDE